MNITDNTSLFISNYEPSNHFLCYNFCYQIAKQTIQADMLNIFMRCESIKEFYFQYFNNPIHKEKNKFYFQSYDNQYIKFDNILRDHIGKYKFFIFLNSSHLLHYNFLSSIQDKIKNSCNIYDSNDKNKPPITIITQDKAIQLIRNGSDLLSLYRIYENFDTLVVDTFKCAPPLPRPTQYGENIIYENDYFILCKTKETLAQDSPLVDSYLYINKRTDRVYNVVNNIVGKLIYYTINSMAIEWQLDENASQKITIEYKPNDTAKFYESFKVVKL